MPVFVFGEVAFMGGSVVNPDAITILEIISGILAYIIPILITLAVVYFIWGVIQYTLSTDQETKKGAKDKIIQGLIGLFVIVSFWGILSVISNTFGVGPAQLQEEDLPCVNIPDVVECE